MSETGDNKIDFDPHTRKDRKSRKKKQENYLFYLKDIPLIILTLFPKIYIGQYTIYDGWVRKQYMSFLSASGDCHTTIPGNHSHPLLPLFIEQKGRCLMPLSGNRYILIFIEKAFFPFLNPFYILVCS